MSKNRLNWMSIQDAKVEGNAMASLGKLVFVADNKDTPINEALRGKLEGITTDGFIVHDAIFQYVLLLDDMTVDSLTADRIKAEPYDLSKASTRYSLRGRWYKLKGTGEECMVTGFGFRDGEYTIEYMNAKQFLKECQWVTGQPCGNVKAVK